MKRAFSICFAKLKQTFLGSLRMQSSYSCHWTAEGAAGAMSMGCVYIRNHSKFDILFIADAALPALTERPGVVVASMAAWVSSLDCTSSGEEGTGKGCSRCSWGHTWPGKPSSLRRWLEQHRERQGRVLCVGESISQPLEQNTAISCLNPAFPCR